LKPQLFSTLVEEQPTSLPNLEVDRVLSLDDTSVLIEDPKVSRHEILKRAIKRFKNKSVAQEATPSYNKIYEMPK
jgi:hypothetical protein